MQRRRGRERDRNTEGERETEIQRERETEIQTERESERESERERERVRETVEGERGETVELGEDGEPIETSISNPQPTERIMEIGLNMQSQNKCTILNFSGMIEVILQGVS